MTIWIYTGGRPSNGARELAALDGFKRVIKGNGIKMTDIVINWGNTKELPFNNGLLYNHHEDVLVAANKLLTFEALTEENIPTVPWTESRDVATSWQQKGYTVVARKTLTGHSGAGIIIVERFDPMPDAPLYTCYINKNKEYRVHVCKQKVIDVQKKIRDPEREPKTWKIRSYANGFIFARNGLEENDRLNNLAIAAVEACGLDFGAVDIIQGKEDKQYYVLEINTAPGLEGQTIQAYADAFRAL
jgi:glutathione synthase/RimK-type ligase-like ATP-grasp enzyme